MTKALSGFVKAKDKISKTQLTIFVLIFGLIGGAILLLTHAAPNPSLPGDLNNDNTVNGLDLSLLLSAWGTNNANDDINSDGTVNGLDLSILLSHWGQSYGGSTIIDQLVTPEGATIEIYSGVSGGWTAQEIYNLLKPSAYQLSVIGPHLTIKVQTQYVSSTTTGISGSGCSYSNYNALTWIDAAPGTNFNLVPDDVLAHEYGHAWTNYYLYMKHCGSWNDYLSERSVLGDPRVDSNYMWSPFEMAAEDYRQLFGDTAAVSGTAQMNYQIPPASSIPGFKDWFINTWGSP